MKKYSRDSYLSEYYRNIRLRVVLGLRAEGWTFDRIARLLGVSRERVRQLNFRAESLRDRGIPI